MVAAMPSCPARILVVDDAPTVREAVARYLERDGFEVAARFADWNGEGDRYCVVFRRVR